MEKAQHVFVGLEQTRLAISESMLLTESLDEGSGLSQLVPGHGGEKMVLDLIV